MGGNSRKEEMMQVIPVSLMDSTNDFGNHLCFVLWYKVFYPNLYAVESENKDAKLFNCVQRGHQNSLEILPIFLATLLVSGVRHPVVAAVLGLIYTVGRFVYFRGYATGVPDNRLKGGIYLIGFLGLIICTAKFAINLLL